MPTTTMVHVRVDEKTKTLATKALSAMGLSISDAVRVFLTRVAYEQAIPFEVKAPNTKSIEAMEEARKGNLPSFSTVSALMDDLNAPD